MLNRPNQSDITHLEVPDHHAKTKLFDRLRNQALVRVDKNHQKATFGCDGEKWPLSFKFIRKAIFFNFSNYKTKRLHLSLKHSFIIIVVAVCFEAGFLYISLTVLRFTM